MADLCIPCSGYGQIATEEYLNFKRCSACGGTGRVRDEETPTPDEILRWKAEYAQSKVGNYDPKSAAQERFLDRCDHARDEAKERGE